MLPTPERPVYYFTSFIPDYRVPVLEALGERLKGGLVVVSGEAPRQGGLDSLVSKPDATYRQQYLPNHYFFGDRLHLSFPSKAFRNSPPPSALLIQEAPRSISTPMLLHQARARGIGSILWGHFSSNNRPFSPQNVADRYRIYLARKASAVLCYTEQIRDMLAGHVPDDRLFVARNTIDTGSLFEIRKGLEREGRHAIRTRLGLPERAPVLVYLGRLLPAKGLDVLLDLFSAYRSKSDARLLIIGDGPYGTVLKNRVAAENMTGIQFLGSIMDHRESAPWLFASDVMVIPGYLGLAVNHAFAFGLPVVSQASPDPRIRFHSPEMAYVKQGQNGFLTPYGDMAAMVGAIETIIDRHVEFSDAATRCAREELSLDQMVDGIYASIEYAMEHGNA